MTLIEAYNYGVKLAAVDAGLVEKDAGVVGAIGREIGKGVRGAGKLGKKLRDSDVGMKLLQHGLVPAGMIGGGIGGMALAKHYAK